MSSKKHNNNNAFTLIELLVVVSIIALLVSILLPALGRARKQAKHVMCQTNMKQWATVMAMYLGENNDRLPDIQDALWAPYFGKYIDNDTDSGSIYVCPELDKEGINRTITFNHHLYNQQILRLPRAIILLGEGSPNPDWGGVCVNWAAQDEMCIFPHPNKTANFLYTDYSVRTREASACGTDDWRRNWCFTD